MSDDVNKVSKLDAVKAVCANNKAKVMAIVALASAVASYLVGDSSASELMNKALALIMGGNLV